MPSDQPIVVIGAGVSGLTTAICLAEVGCTVQVWADQPPRQTTSAVAGAVWGPSFQEPTDRTLAWTEQSLRDFTALAADPDTGVQLATVFTVGDVPTGIDALPPVVRLIPDLRDHPGHEVPGDFTAGSSGTMPMIDMPRYLDHLVGRLASAGVEVQHRRVGSLDEAAAVASVVVNCAGLGARDLAADPSLRPMFGQHVVVTNPGAEGGLMELTTNTEWTSWFAHPERVVCGGTKQADRWDLTPDPDLTDRILERCRQAEPVLRDADVVEVITGLRPDRPSVRVEVEEVGGTRFVHNYGHGGSGVSLSWGCARDAAALATGPRR